LKIIKKLTISRLQIRHRFEGRYQIGLSDPSDLNHSESSLTLTAEGMSEFSLDPSEGLLGAQMQITLKAVPYSPTECSPHTVILTPLISLREMRYVHSMTAPSRCDITGVWKQRHQFPVARWYPCPQLTTNWTSC
jgi:hypothetical protein